MVGRHRTCATPVWRSHARFFVVAKIPILPDFGINFHFIHKWGGEAALVIVVVHVLAASKHHFYDRDNVLVRMLNLRGNRSR